MSGSHDIVEIAAMSGEERRILEARDRTSDRGVGDDPRRVGRWFPSVMALRLRS